MSLELHLRGKRLRGDDVQFVFQGEYEDGDEILLRTESPGRHVWVRLDDTLEPTLAFLAGEEFRFAVPFAERRAGYSPRAFSGDRHLLSARLASAEEIGAYRNLALNPHDGADNRTLFPHAEASVVTRGETAFAARNAIDGLTAGDGHGEWPWTSWGINRDPEASLTVRFGRTVRVSRAALRLRTDFPHDAWWESAELCFSDGSRERMKLEKRAGPQNLDFPERRIEWVRLEKLIKADDPSPFPALTQFEVYGSDEPGGGA